MPVIVGTSYLKRDFYVCVPFVFQRKAIRINSVVSVVAPCTMLCWSNTMFIPQI